MVSTYTYLWLSYLDYGEKIVSILACFSHKNAPGRGGPGLSGVHRRGSALLVIAPDCIFSSDRVRSKCRRQTVQVPSVWVTLDLCAVPCNKRNHTLKNYKRSPRYLIGQITGQLIKK